MLMKRALFWVVALMLGFVAVGVPGLAHADMKLATLNVKGMVCSS
jgi:hypothetical protein